MRHRGTIFTMLLFLLLSCSDVEPTEITLLVTDLPEDTPEDADIYLAGNFNDWNPADPAYLLEKTGDGDLEISFEIDAGELEFKFTRGSWETVEGGPDGADIENRVLVYGGGGGTLQVRILSWVDLAFDPGTAAENVSIMDKEFSMPQLDRNRRIWIYLPPDYEESAGYYPVLYMQDGQNLFNEKTSFVGEWEVDESLNSLFDKGDEGVIVVGIDHGGDRRIDEYSPWLNPDYGGGEGDEYARFLVENLKPYIDANYRTLPGREHTGIMGSSMGGLISMYTAIRYQQVFSKAGCFSPSFWFAGQIFTHVEQTGKKSGMKFFILGAEQEGENMLASIALMKETLLNAGFAEEEIVVQVDSDGAHSEWYWAREFPGAYLWLFE